MDFVEAFGFVIMCFACCCMFYVLIEALKEMIY